MMDLTPFIADPNEKPLDRICIDGGMCAIFRTIACIGDSLSSGEFESWDEQRKTGWHDYYEYSWGQYIARMTGARVYNFSKGGMTAKQYMAAFADKKGFWADDKLAQAYILALGVNDILNQHQPIGSVDDIDLNDWRNNADTFAGHFGAIIQRYKELQPKARFFLITMPRRDNDEKNSACAEHAALLYDLAKLFDFTYVIDLFRYAPVYDAEFRRNFYLAHHMNPAGYLLSAKMIASYIDYIVRNHPEDFAQVGFIGTPFYNAKAKW
ncbi:MAG: SGNH/GDSL hydrolase family protein [Clostridia bacterium]|nr:SGNH/GDSL hydrolase family protein [Clostridia bacterium]